MATSNILSVLQKVLLPKRLPEKGTAVTNTYSSQNADQVLALPGYRDHMEDIFSTRASLDSRDLIQQMFRTDPDMSATVNAFLTVADTTPIFLVYDANKQLDPAGQDLLNQLLVGLTTRTDYTKGFKIIPTLNSIAEAARYMILLRGAIGGELILNKEFIPTEIRMVDPAKLEWFEKAPGQFTPQQNTVNGEKISLDIPNFFMSWFRRDPTSIYTFSPFVAAINTIAARQQVINDLYRIMKVTGYPRMEVVVLEEVIMKLAPPEAKTNPEKKQAYVRSIMEGVRNTLSTLRPEQAFVHTESIESKVLNEKTPGMAINIDSVIQTLNAQNQAGLKTMATIIGRGESGVNTASVEARIFSLSAQAINEPIGDWLSQIFTLGVRMLGSTSHVVCTFAPVEMKSDLELEANLLIKAGRLREDLSRGAITDDEYHLWMYNRLPPKGAPKLSGTNFQDSAPVGVDATRISPNGSPVARSATAEGGNGALRDKKTAPRGSK
jgi:hypothetical protein